MLHSQVLKQRHQEGPVEAVAIPCIATFISSPLGASSELAGNQFPW